MVEIVRGDTTFLEWVITSAVDDSGNPVTDLTGFTFRLQARPHPNSNDVLFTKTSSDGSIVVSGNVVRVRLSPADTFSIPSGKDIYVDLEAEGDGARFTVFAQEHPVRIRVLPDITR